MAAKKMTLKRRIRREKQRIRMANEKNFNSRGGLPSEIIMYDTRVPTEALMRFRYVCKQWKDLTKDPFFVDLHSRRSYNPPGFIFYRPRTRSCIQFFDIDNKKKRTYWSPRDKNHFLSDKEIYILSSLNGLLIISCFDRDSWNHWGDFAYNPITGFHSEKLPRLVFHDEGIYEMQESYFCLAYDSIVAKYKVVRFVYGRTTSGDCEHICKILTLGEENSWRDVVIPKPHNYYIYRAARCRPVYASGYIYMIIAMEKGSNRIICFDVNRESFYITSLPKHEEDDWIDLLEMAGLLCFVHNDMQSCLKLWVLKEEEEGDLDNNDHNKQHDQWREECSIDTGHFVESGLPSHCCFPFAIVKHPKSMKLFFSYSDGDYSDYDGYFPYVYCSYDLEAKQVEVLLQQSGSYHGGSRLELHLNSLAYF